MATITLQQAVDSLAALPIEVQNELAKKLAAYAEGWQNLRDGIAEAREDIENDRVTDVSSIDAFVDNLSKEHGRS